MDAKKILFCGGGTGWHAQPIVSMYHYLSDNKNYKFLWLWERDSIEEQLAEKFLIDFRQISAGKIRRYFDLRNFYEPLKNLTGIVESLIHIQKFWPDIIFSKGGFVSLPVCIAWFILQKNVYLHESDSVMGLANKICSQLATKVFYSFPNDKTRDESQKKHIYSGHIMSSELVWGIRNIIVKENQKLNVLVIGGSQGSHRISEALLPVLNELKDIEFHIILGTLNEHLISEFEVFENAHPYWFIDQKELGYLMKTADIAITRSSSTLWELLHFGVHSIMVPLKNTGWNHQTHNANYFKDEYGFIMLDEDGDLSAELKHYCEKYKFLRKKNLNLENYFAGIEKITEEIWI